MSKGKGLDFWLGEREPRVEDSVKDQQAFEPTSLEALKDKLALHSPAKDFFASSASFSTAQQLRTKDEGVLPPYCDASNTATIRPQLQDNTDHGESSFAWFHATATFINNIPKDQLRLGLKLTENDLLFACINSLVLRSSDTLELWRATCHRLFTPLLMDNRTARSLEYIVKWIFLEGIGCLSAESDIRRLANIGHGYWETAARRLWAPSISRAGLKTSAGSEVRNSIISYYLLVDITRALHCGTTVTVASSFKDIPLISPDLSIAHIRTVLIGKLQPLPDNISSDEAFLILLVVLNEIITYSSLRRRKHILLDGESIVPNKASSMESEEDSFVPLSPAHEILRAHKTLTRVLDGWRSSYLLSSGSDRSALLYFCKMYLAFPELHILPVLLGYQTAKSDAVIQPRAVSRFCNMNESIISESSHYAWLILENINRCDSFRPIWCPIVTFYAALVVWMCIQLQGNFEKSRGSLMVLRLFKAELEKMPWLCCAEMATFLEGLISE